jgi:hypothetical protein
VGLFDRIRNFFGRGEEITPTPEPTTPSVDVSGDEFIVTDDSGSSVLSDNVIDSIADAIISGDKVSISAVDEYGNTVDLWMKGGWDPDKVMDFFDEYDMDFGEAVADAIADNADGVSARGNFDGGSVASMTLHVH